MYHKTDVHIGRRLRERRRALGLSQTVVAEGLKISFQQLQKYETGRNRISGSRLADLAKFLDTSVNYFFENLPEDSTSPRASERQDNFALELARIVEAVENPRLRKQLLLFVKSIAKSLRTH